MPADRLAYGLLHASGMPVTDPLGGVPVAFDTIEEAREWWQPGFTIVRLVDDPDAEDGLEYVPVLADGK